jgi:isopenicillin-N epimerase
VGGSISVGCTVDLGNDVRMNCADWLLDPDIAYLNHGAFGAVPRIVAQAAAEHRLMMERDPMDLLARRLPRLIDDVREQVSDLLHADPARTVFMPNATTGTATVVASLAPSLEPGDEMLTTDHRYAAVAAQFQRTAAERGTSAVVASVPLNARTAADVVEAITERITDRTRLLVVDAIASPTGFRFPVAEIVTAAHERGVPVLVDGAHAPGQIAVDIEATGADFWTGNLHKWVCCPRAVAVLCVTQAWTDTVRPLVASHGFFHGLHESFDWTGTFDPTNLLAVPAALEFWAAIGWEEMRRVQRSLVDAGAQQVATALGTRVPISNDFRAAMRIVELPVVLDNDQSRSLEQALSEKFRVEVSVMQMADTSYVRVCGQVYNAPDDFDRLATGLTALLQPE